MRWFFAIPLVVCLALPSAVIAAPPGPESAVLGDTEAYLALPPELIAAPEVKRVVWSFDRRYLLLQRTEMHLTPDLLRTIAAGVAGKEPGPPPAAVCLVLWDSRTHTSREMWRADNRTSRIEQLEWLPRAYTALAVISTTAPEDSAHPGSLVQRQSVLRIVPSLAAAQTLGFTAGRGEDDVSIEVSPSQPLAILKRTHVETTHQLAGQDGEVPGSAPSPDTPGDAGRFEVARVNYVINGDGSVGPAIQTPGGKLNLQGDIAWAPDGSPILQEIVPTDQPGKMTVQSFAVDTHSGQITPLAKLPEPPPPSAPVLTAGPSALSVQLVRAPVREGDTNAALGVLWLVGTARTGATRIILASGSTAGGDLLPDWQGAVYEANGAWWVAPILRVSRPQYEQARIAAQRTVLISNAKQLGLSLLMYSQDYDETLPTGDGINDKLEPYLKNPGLFDGFVYTYQGGKLSDIPNPSETELGYVSGPGGSAVIFADGHVKWRNGP